MKNYFLTAVCGLFLVSAASSVRAECKTTPDCTAMGYTKTEKDCPNGSIKCPWNTSLIFCDAELELESLACMMITAVTVPANGHCTGTNVNCPSKCTEWACNDGYKKSGDTCIDGCANITAVTVPANATCSLLSIYCPSKCEGWTCNDGYTKVGNSCKELINDTCPMGTFWSSRANCCVRSGCSGANCPCY